MLDMVAWYVASTAIGIAGLVPAATLFRRLSTRGVLAARPLGALLVALLAWLVAALSPIPYGTPLAVAATLSLLALGAARLHHDRTLLADIRDRVHTMIGGEILHATVFCALVVIRSWSPAALFIEKPMEAMMLTSVHAARDMPPPDLWLSGHDVSYYYLGYVTLDIIQRLAGVPPANAIVLGFATMVAAAVLLTASFWIDVASTISRRSARFVVAGVALITANVWIVAPPLVLMRYGSTGIPYHDWLNSVYLTDNFILGERLGWWWLYSNSDALPSSFIQSPAYAIVIGDLHSYVAGLPLLIMGLLVAVDALRHGPDPPARWLKRRGLFAVTSLFFAGLAMTNIWDAVTCGLVWLAALSFRSYAGGRLLHRAVFVAGAHILPVALCALLIAAPMLQSFDAPIPRLIPALGYVSSPWELLRHWGVLLIPVATALALVRPRAPIRTILAANALACLPLLVSFTAFASSDAPPAIGGWDAESVIGLVAVALMAGTVAAMAITSATDDRQTEATWLFMIAAGLAIVMLIEMFQLTGGYGLNRANTLLKFGFPAWTLLAMGGAIGVMDGLARPRRSLRDPGVRRIRAATIIAAGFAAWLPWVAGLVFLPLALFTRFHEGQLHGLDSFAYLQEADPAAAAAVRWAHTNLDPEHHVLIEAVSVSFHFGGVISTMGGIPTLTTWGYHERHWRQAPPIDVRERATDLIYRGGGNDDSLHTARSHAVTHVYIGARERAEFGAIVDEGFTDWPVVFEAGGARIVAVPVSALP